jgi:Glycosyl hydrolase family 12
MKRLARALVGVGIIGIAAAMVAPAGAEPLLPKPMSVTPEPLSKPATLCDNETGLVDNSVHQPFIIRTPHWRGRAGSLCVHTSGHAQFRITKVPVTDNRVDSFPDIVTGCNQWVCTPHTKMPLQVRRIHTLRSTWWIRGAGARGVWNAAYDIWLGKKPFNADGSSTRSGAELMVWPNYSESYAGNPIVKIDGRRWYFMHWRTCDHVRDRRHHGGVPAADATCFNYISFRAVHRTWRVNHLDLKAFIRWPIHHRHLIRPTWWVEGVGTGFELWRGGLGLGTANFRVALHETIPAAETTVRAVRTTLIHAGFHRIAISKPKGSMHVIVRARRSGLLPRYTAALRRHGFTVKRDPRHRRSRLFVA